MSALKLFTGHQEGHPACKKSRSNNASLKVHFWRDAESRMQQQQQQQIGMPSFKLLNNAYTFRPKSSLKRLANKKKVAFLVVVD